MPVLEFLSVQMVTESLEVNPELLAHCSKFKCLHLRDCLRSYDVHEISYYQPTELPEMTRLFLSGTSALAFHPDTLHSAKALKNLFLGSPNSIY